jgi:hypothetical protein
LKPEFKKIFEINASRVENELISMNEPGTYTIAPSSGEFIGVLVTSNGESEFEVSTDWNFIDSVGFFPVTPIQSPSLAPSSSSIANSTIFPATAIAGASATATTTS